ncbi:methylmalonyl-CoA mutase subunit beta [Roseibium sp. RKSG952]|uniref:methylmalonyl-CoA mutase subunit beta n=1 Tax=Roseibium sp. RKSG952 TaxID=2529384 RepID=UPI0012BBB8CA|nr:methylmalonyl-CoA mutase subunit beta [Roseibium sp. RKSG952]MTH97965.1 methylmalonyl-CoA mutase [Roseibium sp. RKSG952]
MTHSTSLSVPDTFLDATEADWHKAVEAALKGASPDRLKSVTEDGIGIEPLYTGRRDTTPRQGREAGVPWSVIQRVDLVDPADANRQILAELEGGASGLELVSHGSALAYGAGIRIETLGDMETLLEGVHTDLVGLRLSAGHNSLGMLAVLNAYLDKKAADPQGLNLSAGFDPFSLMVLGKGTPLDVQRARVNDALAALERIGSIARLIEADGRVWHDAGASPVQELAIVMSAAIAYLRGFEDSGTLPENWADRISFTLVADQDQISTIAKARAARRLWAGVLDACGLPQAPMQLHMQTSSRMLSRRDPWVNLLRNTVASFAAGVGGADSVAVLPHTQALGLPDAFARRLARNTQSILLEESNLYRVADPAAGSGAMEARTEAFAGAAWELLQDIEAAGGLEAAIEKGEIQSRINATVQERRKAIAHRKRPLTGISEFPNLEEKPVSVLPVPDTSTAPERNKPELPDPSDGARFTALYDAVTKGARITDLADTPPQATVPVLTLHHDAEEFEALRDAADAFLLNTGTKPGVFLACLGPLAQFTARATWTANTFAAGGLAGLGGGAADSLEALIESFRASGTSEVCLVSSDAIYEAQAEEAARALKQAGACYIYMAGRPKDLKQRFEAAGIDEFIYAGADILDLLQRAHHRLGLIPSDGPVAQGSDSEEQK